jgi:hypothetical protein
VETAQVVNCLPTECKAPSSNPKLTKKKKRQLKRMKMKRQATERKKVFINHIFQEGLIFKLYKEISKLINKTNFFNGQMVLNRYFTPRKIYTDSK